MKAVPTDMASIQSDGFEFALDALDSLGLGRGQIFEPDILRAIQRCVRPGDTVVDIGANIGYFTAHLARAVGPDGVVHAIEPEPSNFALLRHNMDRNGLHQVHLHAVALGVSSGMATLHMGSGNNGMHRLYESVCCSTDSVAVPVQRLDDLLRDVRAVQFIKIDVEGYEHHVLQGATELVRRSQQLTMVSEYCPTALLEAGASPSGLLKSLQFLGLMPHDLSGAAVSLRALLDDANLYEGFGRDRFVDACAGRSQEEILSTVVQLAKNLGCQRPVIENLLFARATHAERLPSA